MSERNTPLVGCNYCGKSVSLDEVVDEDLLVPSTGEWITYYYCDACFEKLYPDDS